MKKLIVFIFILLFSHSVFAASYYVDFDSGSDSDNGTTTGTPWKHIPWDSNATATAAGTSLSAGDDISLQGGVLYGVGELSADDTMFAIDDAGAADNKIVIQSYGSGKAIIHGGKAIDETQFSLHSGSIYVATKANLGLTGTTIQGVYEYANREVISRWVGTYQVQANSTLGDPCMYYDDGTNIYIRTTDDTAPSAVNHDLHVTISDICFYSSSTTNVGYKFKDLEIVGFGDYGIRVLATSASHNGYGVEVDNCDLYYCASENNTGRTAFMTGTSVWMHDTTIANTRSGELGNGVSIGSSNDSGSLLEDNTLIHFGRTGISLNGTRTHIIRRNFIADQEVSTLSQHQQIQHFMQPGSTIGEVYLYRNVLFNMGSDASFFDNETTHGTVYIWNNTVYENRTSNMGNSFILYNYSEHDTCASGAPVIISRNNFVTRRLHVRSSWPECATSVLEYNYYISDGSNSVFDLNGGSYKYLNAENGSPYFRDDYPQYEGNSVQVIDDDINLMDYYESITYGDANFLHPKVGSPTINAGTTISDGENGLDHDGNTITGTYDIGAYEYDSEESSTTKQSISGYFNIN